MTRRVLILALCATLIGGIAPAAYAAGAKLALQQTDTKPGSGRPAISGNTVTIHYTGWLYSPKSSKQRGARFDSSLDAAPYIFKLGGGSVIQGWEQGIIGMKVGGKRTLIVPAELGFGKAGLGPVPSGANLIFDIELMDVKN